MSTEQNSPHVSFQIEQDRSLVVASRQEPERRNETKSCSCCPGPWGSPCYDIVVALLYIIVTVAKMSSRKKLDDEVLNTWLDDSYLVLASSLVAELISSCLLFWSIVEDFAKWCLIAHWTTYFLVVYQMVQHYLVLKEVKYNPSIADYVESGFVTLVYRAIGTCAICAWISNQH